MDDGYTFADLWDAVNVLNPRQPDERGTGDHVLIMIIPNLIAYETARNKFSFELNNVGRNIAFNTLLRAYWDMCTLGHFRIKNEG